jgi:penicillin-binding protein 1A
MNYSKSSIIRKQKKIRSGTDKITTKVYISAFRVFIVVMAALFVTGACSAYGIYRAVLDKAPDIDTIDISPQGYSTTIYDCNGTVTQKLVGSDANRIYKSLDDIPDIVQKAFIAIEDARFYEHNGIDVRGIMRAAVSGLLSGEFDQGASTLTQQLIKNTVFDGGNESNFIDRIERKIQEQYLAVELEKKIDKDQILEDYLNTINLGQNTLGVEAASLRYFNKDVSELTLSEAAVIAGITQNPYYYNPISYPEKNKEKRAIVLQYMEKQGYITEEEHAEALNDDVYTRIDLVNSQHYSGTDVNSYFTDAVINQVQYDLQEQLGYNSTTAINLIYRSGLSIYTTQDLRIQDICDETFQDESMFPSDSVWELSYQLSVMDKDGEEHHYSSQTMQTYFRKNGYSEFNLYFKSKKDAKPYIKKYKKAVMSKGDTITGEVKTFTIQPQTSLVIMDQHTGEVKALIGGRGQKTANRILNRATDSVRQPGSTFKILSTFLPALDTAGMTLATVQDDAPYSYPNGKSVRNWYTTGYKGLTSLREAITKSMNIVTVKTLADPNVTPQTGYDYLLKLGFTTLVEKRTTDSGTYSDIDLSMALGGLTDGVTNLELTAAYAAIANKGVYIEPILYTKVVDADGNVLLDNTAEDAKTSRQVMKESTAWLLTSAMEDVIKKPHGTATDVKFTSIRMAEAGKTGTTSNDIDLWFEGFTPYYTAGIWSGYDNNRSQTDTEYHKKLWKEVMERIHSELNLKKKDFEKPDNVVSASVCTKCGKLAVNGLCDLAKGGSCIRTEYFASGTEPTENCNCHVAFHVCTESGKLATEYCPEDKQETRVYLLKDEENETQDTPNILPKRLENSSCDVHTSYFDAIVSEETEGTETEDENETEDTTESRDEAESGENSGNEESTGSTENSKSTKKKTATDESTSKKASSGKNTSKNN